MKKYLPIFFFFLILNHAQSQFSSGTSTWSSGTYFSLGSGTNASGSGAIAFGLSTSAYQGAVMLIMHIILAQSQLVMTIIHMAMEQQV